MFILPSGRAALDDFDRQIDDFRNRLARETTAIFNDQTVNRWLQTAGRLTLAGLDREGSTFDEAVKDMVAQASEAEMPVAVWLTPRPGSSVPFHQSWWRHQLLLYTAARDEKRRGRVGELFKRHEQAVTGMVEQAECVLMADRNLHRWADRLGAAILVLKEREILRPYQLNERVLQYDGKELRLSNQEADLFHALHEAYPDGVDFTRLKDLGIPNPIQRKSALDEKLTLQGAPVEIVTEGQRYRLAFR